MVVLPDKTWGMAKPSLANKSHLSSGCNRNYERNTADGYAHHQRVGAKQRRPTLSCPCSLSCLVTLRVGSHGPLPRPTQTGEFVDLRPRSREVALC